MQFDEKTIKRIKEKYKDAFDALEYYDRTRIKLWKEPKSTKQNIKMSQPTN